jgi:hypothetical protein
MANLKRSLNVGLTLGVAASLAVGAAWAAEKIVWKPLDRVLLKVDEKPARIWSVYHVDKKDNLLLVALGRRYLLLDIREHQIYELDPAKLERRDKDLLWREADRPAKPLPTEDWTVRDVGPARRIRAKLASEGRVLEVQVPIQPDLRHFY